MRRPTTLLTGLALVLALAAGPESWARLIWMAGAPGLALPLISDPSARGAALYELGRYSEADAVFAEVGRSATYNRGLTLAMTGRYDLSLAYFDAYLFANRYDAGGERNRAIVATLVEPVIGEAMGTGRIRTILREQGVETAAFDAEDPDAPLMPAERDPFRAIHRPLKTPEAVAASDAWLDALPDSPGIYLRRRLAAEMKRRRELEIAMPEEPVPW